jgi:hypothetical protein
LTYIYYAFLIVLNGGPAGFANFYLLLTRFLFIENFYAPPLADRALTSSMGG